MPGSGITRRDQGAVVCLPGETVFCEGDAAEQMYVVIEGELSITKRGVVLETVTEGDSFGEMALIESAPRSATVTAVTESRVAEISRARFEHLIAEQPDFAVRIMRSMADRLRRQTSA
jgi:CRP-like cAMP-binding protein